VGRKEAKGKTKEPQLDADFADTGWPSGPSRKALWVNELGTACSLLLSGAEDAALGAPFGIGAVAFSGLGAAAPAAARHQDWQASPEGRLSRRRVSGWQIGCQVEYIHIRLTFERRKSDSKTEGCGTRR
jgi:hypothetical protein